MTSHTDIQLILPWLGEGERIVRTARANPVYHAKRQEEAVGIGALALLILVAWFWIGHDFAARLAFDGAVKLFLPMFLVLLAAWGLLSPVFAYFEASQTSYVITNWRRFEIRDNKLTDTRYHSHCTMTSPGSRNRYHRARRMKFAKVRFGSIGGCGGGC